MNGLGAVARQWSQTLSALTERDDLDPLTLLAWADALPSRRLLRRRQAWCADCYAEWRATHTPLYQPLLWTLEAVTVCPAHECALLTRCPHAGCGAHLRWLAWRAQPGWCSRCGGWLGVRKRRAEATGERHVALERDERVVAALAVEALTLGQEGERAASGGVARGLGDLIEDRADGSISAFARQVGIPKVTLWGWTRGQTRPELGALLQVCLRTGAALGALLQGQVTCAPVMEHELERRAPVAEVKQRPPRRPARRFDVEEMRQALSAEMERQENPPRSLSAVARLLGWSRRQLMRRLPVECHAISVRYEEYRKAQGLQRREQLAQEARFARRAVEMEGIYPSRRRVAARLRKPGYLRAPVVREALRADEETAEDQEREEIALACLVRQASVYDDTE